MAWTDEFGLNRTNGRDEVEETNRASHITTAGSIKQLVIDIDADAHGLPRANCADGSFGLGVAKIPAGAAVLSAMLAVRKVASGAATLKIGTAKKDGTPIDDDGLIAAADVASKGLQHGEGALMDSIVDEDSYITVADTAGNSDNVKGLIARLVVEFI